MKRLCYGTFAKILLWGISKPKFQTKLHVLLLGILDETYIETKVDPAHASRWFNCIDDVASSFREAALSVNTEVITSRFEKVIIPLINPNKLHLTLSTIRETIVDDEEINDDTIIDSINNIKKIDLISGQPLESIASFLAGAFLYVVVHVDNKSGKTFVPQINALLDISHVNNEVKNTLTEEILHNANQQHINTEQDAREYTGQITDTSPAPANHGLKQRLTFTKAVTTLLFFIFLVAVFVLIYYFRLDNDDFPGVKMAAAGFEHSLALHYDGTLWAWGRNTHGQLGDGTMTARTSPVRVMDSVIFIAAGQNHSFAIMDDGSLWGWGLNSHGHLGDGTNIDRNIPVRIAEDIKYVSSGWGHTLALDFNGVLWAWGVNSSGQVGDGTSIDRYSPITIMDNVIYVSAGQDHSLAILNDDSLWAWGNNEVGQLGNQSTDTHYEPVRVMERVKSVSGGGQHTIAIRTDNSLYAWGRNSEGQLGNSSTISRHYPTLIMESVMHISAGGLHSMAICAEGHLFSWGSNAAGQVDYSMSRIVNEPKLILRDITGIMAGGGNGHSLAISASGTLSAWGANNYGQLGNGTNSGQTAPTNVNFHDNQNGIAAHNLPLRTMVAAGTTHSLALTGDGVLQAWGSNCHGQLGKGTVINSHVPTTVMESVSYVAAGYLHSLAVQSSGSLWAWGYNDAGQLGDGTNIDRVIPVRIMDDIVAASAGSFHSLALDIYGQAWAWGENHWGQLGDGTGECRLEPVKIMESVARISAGHRFSVAVDTDGDLWIWGHWPWGVYQDLHDDYLDTVDYAPRLIEGLHSVMYVSAGFNHIMLIKNDGSLWAWGCNKYGQLGDGTTTDRHEPVQITVLDSIESVSTGDSHTAAVQFLRTGERLLWGWGNNAYGQLGDATTTNSYNPMPIMSPVLSVSSGGYHTLAIDINGHILAWGKNCCGQLGES